jgi:hypothetical protein
MADLVNPLQPCPKERDRAFGFLKRRNLALLGRNLALAMVGRDSVRRIRGLLHRDRDKSRVKIPTRAEALFLIFRDAAA